MECSEAVFSCKFKAINAYIKKEERFQINKLNCHLKTPEKE